MSSKELFELYILTKNNLVFEKAVAAAAREKQKQARRRQEKRARGRFDLEKVHNCKFLFRFTKSEIRSLVHHFHLPNKITISPHDRVTFTGIEALCITLRRLSYPNRLGDLCDLFHRHICQLSKIFNWTLNYLNQNFGHLLSSIDLFWLNPNYLEYYAEKIHQKGAPLTNCVGFIDGTVRANCRPTENQELIYNGHKRLHGLKYQSVVLPNGLITNLYGPISGRRHDGYLLRESDLINNLRPKFDRGPNTPPYCIYGDPAYPMNDPELLAPYRGHPGPVEELFNKHMSSVRQSVEWGLGQVLTYFAFVDFRKNLKLHLQPIALYYKISVLLTNCHTCLNGCNTNDYFGVNPPSIEQYLNNLE